MTHSKTVGFIVSLVLIMSFINSCEKEDPCGQSCVNGYCDDGDCICNDGYGGKWCATYTGNPGGGYTSSGSPSSGNSGQGGDIYVRLAQSLEEGNETSSCFTVANYNDNNPVVPANAGTDVWFGSAKAGTYNASFDFDRNGPLIRFTYKLTDPPAGYDRYYTILLKEYNHALNVCVVGGKVAKNAEPSYQDREAGSGNSGSSGSGNSSGGRTYMNRGSFRIRIYRPAGECVSSNAGMHLRVFMATIGGYTYDAYGNSGIYHSVLRQSGPMEGDGKPYWDYETPSTLHKLTWELRPDASSWPNACSIYGESTVDYDGQTKEVVIRWP